MSSIGGFSAELIATYRRRSLETTAVADFSMTMDVFDEPADDPKIGPYRQPMNLEQVAQMDELVEFLVEFNKDPVSFLIKLTTLETRPTVFNSKNIETLLNWLCQATVLRKHGSFFFAQCVASCLYPNKYLPLMCWKVKKTSDLDAVNFCLDYCAEMMGKPGVTACKYYLHPFMNRVQSAMIGQPIIDVFVQNDEDETKNENTPEALDLLRNLASDNPHYKKFKINLNLRGVFNKQLIDLFTEKLQVVNLELSKPSSSLSPEAAIAFGQAIGKCTNILNLKLHKFRSQWKYQHQKTKGSNSKPNVLLPAVQTFDSSDQDALCFLLSTIPTNTTVKTLTIDDVRLSQGATQALSCFIANTNLDEVVFRSVQWDTYDSILELVNCLSKKPNVKVVCLENVDHRFDSEIVKNQKKRVARQRLLAQRDNERENRRNDLQKLNTLGLTAQNLKIATTFLNTLDELELNKEDPVIVQTCNNIIAFVQNQFTPDKLKNLGNFNWDEMVACAQALDASLNWLIHPKSENLFFLIYKTWALKTIAKYDSNNRLEKIRVKIENTQNLVALQAELKNYAGFWPIGNVKSVFSNLSKELLGLLPKFQHLTSDQKEEAMQTDVRSGPISQSSLAQQNQTVASVLPKHERLYPTIVGEDEKQHLLSEVSPEIELLDVQPATASHHVPSLNLVSLANTAISYPTVTSNPSEDAHQLHLLREYCRGKESAGKNVDPMNSTVSVDVGSSNLTSAPTNFVSTTLVAPTDPATQAQTVRSNPANVDLQRPSNEDGWNEIRQQSESAGRVVSSDVPKILTLA